MLTTLKLRVLSFTVTFLKMRCAELTPTMRPASITKDISSELKVRFSIWEVRNEYAREAWLAMASEVTKTKKRPHARISDRHNILPITNFKANNSVAGAV